jgi:hypothetical protein
LRFCNQNFVRITHIPFSCLVIDALCISLLSSIGAWKIDLAKTASYISLIFDFVK